MSLQAASAVGEAWEALSLLTVIGILKPREYKAALARLEERARKNGVIISHVDPFGRELFHTQIRVHWCGVRGTQVNRYYPKVT